MAVTPDPSLDEMALQSLFSRMRLTGEAASTTEVYKTMIGRSLEVSMDLLGYLALLCAAAGQTSSSSAQVLTLADGGTLKVFAPKLESYQFTAVAFEMEAFNFVALLKRQSGRPAGYADLAALLSQEQVHGDSAAECQEGQSEHEPAAKISEIRLYRTYPEFKGWRDLPVDMDGCAQAVAARYRMADAYHPSLDQTLREAMAGKYLITGIAERKASRAPWRDTEEAWSERPCNTVDLDAWLVFFPAFGAAFQAYGLMEAFKAAGNAFAQRKWDELEGFDDYEAAHTLGNQLAIEEGYLPGAKAAALLSRMWAEAIVRSMGPGKFVLSDIQSVLKLCRAHGHTDKETEFEYNDLDNYMMAPASERPGLDLLVFRDQNRRFVLALFNDSDGTLRQIEVHVFGTTLKEWFEEHFGEGISEETLKRATSVGDDIANPHAEFKLYDYDTVMSQFLGKDPAPSLLARLAVGSDGVITSLIGPGLQADAIRSWNSCVCDIQSAACTLEEKYRTA